MSSSLKNQDYIDILNFYKIEIPNTFSKRKLLAENIMSGKLCRCIKKLQPFNESKSIGICTKTIFVRKGYTRRKFNCKAKASVSFRKTRKNKKNKK